MTPIATSSTLAAPTFTDSDSPLISQSTPFADAERLLAENTDGKNTVIPTRARLARMKSATYAVLARGAYWSPVFVVVVLFAQVSFLGLRPALCESNRLADAEKMLAARHEEASATNHEIAAQLSARQDPIFLERQRRLRTIR